MHICAKDKGAHINFRPLHVDNGCEHCTACLVVCLLYFSLSWSPCSAQSGMNIALSHSMNMRRKLLKS